MKRLLAILRHPAHWYFYRRYFGELGSEAFDKAAATKVYVSRSAQWNIRDCGGEELATAARWSRRAATKVQRAKRQGATRDVRGRSQLRAADLLDSWAAAANGKRIRELPPRTRFRIYREAHDWRCGGLTR